MALNHFRDTHAKGIRTGQKAAKALVGLATGPVAAGWDAGASWRKQRDLRRLLARYFPQDSSAYAGENMSSTHASDRDLKIAFRYAIHKAGRATVHAGMSAGGRTGVIAAVFGQALIPIPGVGAAAGIAVSSLISFMAIRGYRLAKRKSKRTARTVGVHRKGAAYQIWSAVQDRGSWGHLCACAFAIRLMGEHCYMYAVAESRNHADSTIGQDFLKSALSSW